MSYSIINFFTGYYIYLIREKLKAETEHYLRQLLKVSRKIEDRKFKTFQEADRLIKVESDLIIRVGTLLQMDLFNRSRRYIDDPWDW